MALEPSFNYIDDLVDTNPETGDNVNEGDDHLRGIKSAVQGSFPSLGSAAVTKTAAEINDLVEQTDPVLNGTISGTAFLDEDAMTSDSAIAVASQQSIKAYVDSKVGTLNEKIINIGDWNMDSTLSVAVAHGITHTKIRSISVVVRSDSDANYHDFGAFGCVGMYASSTNIILLRETGGTFDNTSYDSTSYNRGWITIQYTD